MTLLCCKPLLRGGMCMLPLGHRTPHHTKCVQVCVNCARRFRGTMFVCFLCREHLRKTRELKWLSS